MEPSSERDLRLLEEIARGGHVTQRSLSHSLGIALGLTNLYLKRLVRKGYIKVTTIPRNRALYLLTPKGLAEKTRLTYEYMSYSLGLYREVRKALREALAPVAQDGHRRIVLFGAGEVAELARLTLQEMGLTLTGIIAEDHEGQRFFEHTIADPASLVGLAYDRIIITTLDPRAGTEMAETLRRYGIPPEKIYSLAGVAAGRWKGRTRQDQGEEKRAG